MSDTPGWGWSPSEALFPGGKVYATVIVRKRDEDKFLVAFHQNKPSPKWRMPGGSVGAYEPPIAAAARELFEEVGIVAMDLFSVFETTRTIDGADWRGYYFGCAGYRGTPFIREPKKFNDLRWVSLPEMQQMDCGWEANIVRKYVMTVGI